MHFKALICDLDETLIRSGHIYDEVQLKAAEKFDIPLTLELLHLHHGLSFPNVIRMYKQVDDAEMETIRMFCRREVANRISQFAWHDGAEDLLDQGRKIPIGIATTSHEKSVDIVDTRLEVRRRVKAIVHGNDVKSHKPDPACLYMVAERLGVFPNHCAYVGDSIVDVEAAKNARMRAILIERPKTPFKAKLLADDVVQTFSQVKKILDL